MEDAMETVTSYLESTKLARKQVHRNLTLFPLLSPTGPEPVYLTLEQSLAADSIQITEKDAEGSVPELLLRNSGKEPVLVIEGEELVGAKQNRIVNATFLVAADSDVVIPVSCVEQGRWRHVSRRFDSGKKMMHASLRREHQQEVRFSLNQGNG
jgi:hypothetical protein